jgi:3-oxoacyl-[acyl-carrier protein] reductase
MIGQKSGNIINISSVFGQTGASCESIYSVSKAGIDGLTKSLAKELGLSGIRVNSIAPGLIDTDMNARLDEDEKQAFIEDEIPLGRIGTPADVANVVEMLEKCDYITGQVINVSGGWNK